MLLNPKIAAKLSSVLFPSERPDEALMSLIQWFDEYAEARNSSRPTINRLETWSNGHKPAEQQPAQPQPIIDRLFGFAKSNNLSLADLAKQVGVSYPTLLNWQKGKAPQGKNLSKIETFLKKD
jgi:DNA-binding XRE family transcriptional regulator